MIIVKLLGGLGNQLFQYAAALALAKKCQAQIQVDISAFAKDQLRDFELSQFNLHTAIAAPREIKNLKASNSLTRLVARLLRNKKKRFYKEPHFHYDPDFLQLGNNVYIQGYFQSEKYFAALRNELLANYSVAHLVSKEVLELGKTLRSMPSVAVHVRKGDYKDPKLADVHGVLPMDYYQRAASFLQERMPGLQFYLFSDDPKNVEKELALASLQIISGNVTKSHYEDFYLMSQCRHNIIANSSFSWWAAWLNNNEDKIVIAPKKWFNNGPKDTQDLLPESWIKI